MTKLTDLREPVSDSTAAAQFPTPEQCARLALVLTAQGYGPEVARWQKQDTKFWATVADEMDQIAEGGQR